MPDPTYVYRGIHGKHPALDAARQGIVFAADPNAQLTPGVHHAGMVSGRSQFTSWTYDLQVARRFARSKVPPGPLGIVLRLEKTEPQPGSEWKWKTSPGENGDEHEVLLQGRRMDAEVLE